MHGRVGDGPPQQWSVHAQFTINQPGIQQDVQTYSEQNDNGFRVFCTWPSKSSVSDGDNTSTSAYSNKSAPSYGFQRGNLTFTSVPPRAKSETINTGQSNKFENLNTVPNLDYYDKTSTSCDDHSKGNQSSFNRKCKSTCNIVLSTTTSDPLQKSSEDDVHERTRNLGCESSVNQFHRPTNLYDCDNPWCYNTRVFRENECTVNSPVQESEASYSTGQTVVEKKVTESRWRDIGVQTFEMVDKCTSPFSSAENFHLNRWRERATLKKYSKEKCVPDKSNVASNIRKQFSPVCFSPDSLENCQSEDLSSKASDCSLLTSLNNRNFVNSTSDDIKKPRTVHIDVYCTGTEQESEISSGDEKTTETPQTVFESKDFCVTHTKSSEKSLPKKIKQCSSIAQPVNLFSNDKLNMEAETDFDNSSTTYPSQLSSYSFIPELSSFSSNIPPSSSIISMDNDYDSTVNTSWKDTFSDIESLMQSCSGINQSQNINLASKKLNSSNIKESNTKFKSPSITSLNPSDSFEYANSYDKCRIKKMEEMWKQATVKSKPPLVVDKQKIFEQQKIRKVNEAQINKTTAFKKIECHDSDSDSDTSVKGWSFIKEHGSLENSSAISRVSQPKAMSVPVDEPIFNDITKKLSLQSPSSADLQQKLLQNPALRAPFMIVPGIFTDQRLVAKKFGNIVHAFKKPGHHIGPAKNPTCQCNHCKSFFEDIKKNKHSGCDIPWINFNNIKN